MIDGRFDIMEDSEDDPTETARAAQLAVLDAVRLMVPTANGIAASAILNDLKLHGFAVVRADLPHGTELRRWQIIGSPGFECWREVSS